MYGTQRTLRRERGEGIAQGRNQLVEVKSPFDRSPDGDAIKASAMIDIAVENETLMAILNEAAVETDALAKVLRS